MATHTLEECAFVPRDLTGAIGRYQAVEANTTHNAVISYGPCRSIASGNIDKCGYAEDNIDAATLRFGLSYYHRDYIGLFLSLYMEAELKRNPDVIFQSRFQTVLRRIIYYDKIRSMTGMGGACAGNVENFDANGTIKLEDYCLTPQSQVPLDAAFFAGLQAAGAPDTFESKKYYTDAQWGAYRLLAVPAVQNQIDAYFQEVDDAKHLKFILDIVKPTFDAIRDYESNPETLSGSDYGFDSIDKVIGSINGMLTSINGSEDNGYGDRISVIQKSMATVIRYLEVFLSTVSSYSLQLDSEKDLQGFWETLRFTPAVLAGAVEKPKTSNDLVDPTKSSSARKILPSKISGLRVLTDVAGVAAQNVGVAAALGPVQAALKKINDIPESDAVMTLVRGSIYRDTTGKVEAGYLDNIKSDQVRDAALDRSKKYLDAITVDTELPAPVPGMGLTWTNRLKAYNENYPSRQTGGARREARREARRIRGPFVKPFMSGGAAIALNEITRELKDLEKETRLLNESLTLANTNRTLREATVFDNPDLNGLDGLQQRNEYFVDMMNVMMGYTSTVGQLASNDARANQETEERMQRFGKELSATWDTLSRPVGLAEPSKLLVDLQAQGVLSTSQIRDIIDSDILNADTWKPETNPVLKEATEIRRINAIEEKVGEGNIPGIVAALSSIVKKESTALLKTGSFEDLYRDLTINYAAYQDSSARADTLRNQVLGSVADMDAIKQFTGETVSRNLRSINSIGKEIINLGSETALRSLMRRSAKVIGDRYKAMANKLNDYLKSLKDNLKNLENLPRADQGELRPTVSNFEYEKLKDVYIDGYLNKLILSSSNLIPHYSYQSQINQIKARTEALRKNDLQLQITATATFENYQWDRPILGLVPRISKTSTVFKDPPANVGVMATRIMNYLSIYSTGSNAELIRLFPRLYNRLEFPVIIRNLLDSFSVVSLETIKTLFEILETHKTDFSQTEKDDLMMGGLTELRKLAGFYTLNGKDEAFTYPPVGPDMADDQYMQNDQLIKRIADIQNAFSQNHSPANRREMVEMIRTVNLTNGIVTSILSFFSNPVDQNLQTTIEAHIYQSASLMKLPLRTEDGAANNAIAANLKLYNEMIREAAARYDASLVKLFDEKLQEKYQLLESTIFMQSGSSPYFNQIREDRRLAHLESFKATQVGLVSDRKIIIPTGDGRVPDDFTGKVWMPNLVVADAGNIGGGGLHMAQPLYYLNDQIWSSYEIVNSEPDVNDILNKVNTANDATDRPYTLLSAEQGQRSDRDLIFSQMEDFVGKTMPFLQLMKSMLDQNIEIKNAGPRILNDCALINIADEQYTNPFLFSVKDTNGGAVIRAVISLQNGIGGGWSDAEYSHSDNVLRLVPQIYAVPSSDSTDAANGQYPLDNLNDEERCPLPRYTGTVGTRAVGGPTIFTVAGEDTFSFAERKGPQINIQRNANLKVGDIDTLIKVFTTATNAIKIMRALTPLIEPLRDLITENPDIHNYSTTSIPNQVTAVNLQQRRTNKQTLLSVLPEMIEIDRMIQNNLSRAPSLTALNAGVGLLKDAFSNCLKIAQDMDPDTATFNEQMIPVWLFTRKIISLWYMICGHILTNIIVHGVGVTMIRVIGCLPMNTDELIKMEGHKKLLVDSGVHDRQIRDVIDAARDTITRQQANYPIIVGDPELSQEDLDKMAEMQADFEDHVKESKKIKDDADPLAQQITDTLCKVVINDPDDPRKSDIDTLQNIRCKDNAIKQELLEKVRTYRDVADRLLNAYTIWSDGYRKGTLKWNDHTTELAALERTQRAAREDLRILNEIIDKIAKAGQTTWNNLTNAVQSKTKPVRDFIKTSTQAGLSYLPNFPSFAEELDPEEQTAKENQTWFSSFIPRNVFSADQSGGAPDAHPILRAGHGEDGYPVQQILAGSDMQISEIKLENPHPVDESFQIESSIGPGQFQWLAGIPAGESNVLTFFSELTKQKLNVHCRNIMKLHIFSTPEAIKFMIDRYDQHFDNYSDDMAHRFLEQFFTVDSEIIKYDKETEEDTENNYNIYFSILYGMGADEDQKEDIITIPANDFTTHFLAYAQDDPKSDNSPNARSIINTFTSWDGKEWIIHPDQKTAGSEAQQLFESIAQKTPETFVDAVNIFTQASATTRINALKYMRMKLYPDSNEKIREYSMFFLTAVVSYVTVSMIASINSMVQAINKAYKAAGIASLGFDTKFNNFVKSCPNYSKYLGADKTVMGASDSDANWNSIRVLLLEDSSRDVRHVLKSIDAALKVHRNRTDFEAIIEKSKALLLNLPPAPPLIKNGDQSDQGMTIEDRIRQKSPSPSVTPVMRGGASDTQISKETRQFVYNTYHLESSLNAGAFQWIAAMAAGAGNAEKFFTELNNQKINQICAEIEDIERVSQKDFLEKLKIDDVTCTDFDKCAQRIYTLAFGSGIGNVKAATRKSGAITDHTESFLDYTQDIITSPTNIYKSVESMSTGSYAQWDGSKWIVHSNQAAAERAAQDLANKMTAGYNDFIVGVKAFTEADATTRINALKYAQTTYFSADLPKLRLFFLTALYHFIMDPKINEINRNLTTISDAYEKSSIADLGFDQLFKAFVDKHQQYLKYANVNRTMIKPCLDNAQWSNTSVILIQNASPEQIAILGKILTSMNLIKNQKDHGTLVKNYEDTLRNYRKSVELEEHIEESIKKSSSELSTRITQYKRMTAVSSMIIFNPYYRRFALIDPETLSTEMDAAISNQTSVLQMISDNLGHIWDEFIMNQIRQTQFECYSSYRLALRSLIGGKSAVDLVYQQMSFGLIEFYYDILDTIVGCLDGKTLATYNEVEDYFFRYHYIQIKRCHALFRWIKQDFVPSLQAQDEQNRARGDDNIVTFEKKIIIAKTSADAKEIFGEFMGLRTLLEQYRSITMDKVQLHLRINDFLSRGYNDGLTTPECLAVKELDPKKPEYHQALANPKDKILFYNKANMLQVDFGFLQKVRNCNKQDVANDPDTYYSSIHKKMQDPANPGIPFERIYNTADFPSSDIISNYMSIAPNIVAGKGTVLMTYGYSGTGKSASLFGISSQNINGILQSTFDQFNLDEGNKVIFMRVYEIYGFGTQYNYYWNPGTPPGSDCFPDFSQYIIHHKIQTNGDNLQSVDRAFLGNRHDAFNYIMQMKVPDENTVNGRGQVPWYLHDTRTMNYQSALGSTAAVVAPPVQAHHEVRSGVYIKITKDNYKNFDAFIKSIDELRMRGSRITNLFADNLTQIKKTVNNPESSRSILVYDFQICLNYDQTMANYQKNVWVPFLIYDLPGKEDIYRTYVDTPSGGDPSAGFSDLNGDGPAKARKSTCVTNPIMIPAFDDNCVKIADFLKTVKIANEPAFVNELLNMPITSFGYDYDSADGKMIPGKTIQIKTFYQTPPTTFVDLFNIDRTIVSAKSNRRNNSYITLFKNGQPGFIADSQSNYNDTGRANAFKEIMISVQIPLIALLIKYQYFDVVAAIVSQVTGWPVERVYAFYEAYYINENVVGLLKYLLDKVLVKKRTGGGDIALQTTHNDDITATVSKYYIDAMLYRFMKLEGKAGGTVNDNYYLAIPPSLVALRSNDPLFNKNVADLFTSMKTRQSNNTYALKGSTTSNAISDVEHVISFANRAEYNANSIFRGYTKTCTGTPKVVDPVKVEAGDSPDAASVSEVNRPLLQDFIEPYGEKISFYYLFYVLSNTAHTRKAEEQIKLLSNSMPFIDQMDPAVKKSKCLE